MSSKPKVIILMTLTLVLPVAIAMACDGADPSRVGLNPGGKASSSAAPTATPSIRTGDGLTVEQRENALSSVAWVGQIHTAAMRDLLENKSAWVPAEGNRWEQACEAAVRVTAKYVPLIDTHVGVTRSREEALALAKRAVAAHPLCGEVTASIFGLPRALAYAATVVARAVDDSVSADVVPYLEDLQSAVAATDGTTAAVTSAVNSVLGSASSLAYGDYQALAAVGGFAIDSYEEWNDYDWSGTPGGEWCDDEENPYCRPMPESIFMRRFGFWKKAGIVGDADLVGCMSGAMSALWPAIVSGGVVGLGVVAGNCGIWGIGGSVVTAVAMM